jgi:glutathione S-transferase
MQALWPKPERSVPSDTVATGLVLWGSELSPFCLKLSAMLTRSGLAHRWLPEEGGRLENLRAVALIQRAKRSRTVVRHGGADELDEYPAVPFLVDEQRRVHYDSTALAGWIDENRPAPGGPLIPEDPALEFLTRFVDEAFDEFGLYMVHHNRWVLSAGQNDAGDRFAAEFTRLLPSPAGPMISQRITARQTRRLPYLFSVAPDELEQDLPPALLAPTRAGFPPTHALLDHSWHAYLAAMETLLEAQPYIFGDRFTLADASAYGQLSMNLTDAPAARQLEDVAPRTFRWLCDIRDGAHVGDGGDLGLSDALAPLLRCIADTFVPLMQQNELAYDDAVASGETLFNEAAFDEGRALYDGEMSGSSFRSVVKSFQVRTWRDLRAGWNSLGEAERTVVSRSLPDLDTAFEALDAR